jgi:hypothetical protein
LRTEIPKERAARLLERSPGDEDIVRKLYGGTGRKKNGDGGRWMLLNKMGCCESWFRRCREARKIMQRER